jgi:hypothetical protein
MHCKNCNSNLSSNHKYCYDCGAKVITQRLTLKHIVANVNAQFFNYDNNFLKTFLHLLSKPELVIEGYINGVRKKYINVIQYLAISLTLTGLYFFILNTFYDNPFAIDSSIFIANSEAVKNPESIKEITEQTSKIMGNYYSLIYIISIPISAIVTWLVFYFSDRKYNYTEHIILNTYYSSQLSLINIILGIILVTLGINYMNTSLILPPISFLYLAYIFKRVYKLSFFMAFVNILLFGVFYTVTFAIVGVIGVLIGFIIALIMK